MDYLRKNFPRADGYYGMVFDGSDLAFIERGLAAAWVAGARIGTVRFVRTERLDRKCDNRLAALLMAGQIERLEFAQNTYTCATLIRVSDAMRYNRSLELLSFEDTPGLNFKDAVRKHLVESLRIRPRDPSRMRIFYFVDPAVSVDSSTPNDLLWLLDQAKTQ